MDMRQPITLEAAVKLVTVGVSVVALIWGGVSFLIAKRLEARRPYLDYQLELYKETTKVAVTLATSTDSAEVDTARKRFYRLYWSELALIETPEVESQMVKFERALKASSDSLQYQALYLAHVLRSSLAKSWGIEDWKYIRPSKRD